MSKKLVAYFSASGVTAKLAKEISQLVNADLFEIVPESLYTKQDLDYTKKDSRSSLEMSDLSSRPAVKYCVDNMDQYDTVFVGFPVWWYREPSIVDTFLDAYDFTDKKIIPFCTSGGSDIEGASKRISELTKTTVEKGLRLGENYSMEELKSWVESL